MVSSLGFGIYSLVNVGFVVVTGVLTLLSFHAYRHSARQQSYLIATIGFTCILLGGLSEAMFSLVIEPDFVLSSTEYLYVQVAEDSLSTIGLGLLFYAITQHNPDTSQTDRRRLIETEDYPVSGYSDDD